MDAEAVDPSSGAIAPHDAKRPTGLLEARKIASDLFRPKAGIYWPDLLLSAGLGWSAFIWTVSVPQFSGAWWLGFVGAVLLLYRAVLFIHELTHISAGDLPGFEQAWNLIIGVPLMAPSFTYVGVHTEHHKRNVYGTELDPEYLPLGSGARWRIVLFLVETVAVPAVIALRFLVAGPISWFIPPLRRVLERHASSLVINMAYRRPDLRPAERRRMLFWEFLIVALWGGLIALVVTGVLPTRLLVTWYAVSFGITATNQLRTLAAHRYGNPNEERMDVIGQLTDSINVPGKWWTGIWAPVGLRYHALHHWLPDLPYHSLATAHRRLMAQLPEDAPYRETLSSGLFSAVGELWMAPRGGETAARKDQGRAPAS